MTENDEALKDKILVDQVSRFISQAVKGIYATLLLSSLLAVMLWEEVAQSHICAWWSLTMLIGVARLILYIRARQQPLTGERAHQLKKFSLVPLFLSGCAWGAAPLFLFPYFSLPHQMLLIFVLGGMIAGSASVFASIRGGFHAFCLPILLPLLIVLLSIHDSVHTAMAISFFIFFLFMDQANRTINLDISNFLILKYKNIDLIEHLETEIREKEVAENQLILRNQQIEAIVSERTDELRQVNNVLLGEISERIKTEQSLRESEERFKTLHNASFGGIAIHEQGLILDCNHGLSEITGYAVDELIGMDGMRLIAPQWRSTVMENIRSDFDKAYDAEGVRKNGQVYPLNLRGKNIPYKNRTVRVTEFRDITERVLAEEERKQLQAQLVQVQKMEAIGTMAGGIAHDFNNILAGIVGYAEIVLRNLTGQQNEKNQQHLRSILAAGERAKSLIQKILTFSRQAETEPRPLRIQRTITEVLQLIRVSLPSNITIETHLDSQATVLADPIHIHQVFMNLCANSGHAMKEQGGILTITLEDVSFEAGCTERLPAISPGEYVRIVVADTGKGIPPSLLDRIFDPFFTTKEKGQGTGLGLAMAHGIITAMHGLITVESTEGLGTRFTVYLPITHEEEKAAPAEPTLSPVGQEHVVYVDDEEFLVEIGTEILRELGYRVTGFTDSIRALQYVQEHAASVDLVISDMSMPKLSGVELAQNLQQLASPPPVIMYTGHNEGLSASALAAMGIRDILLKPITTDNLAVAVRAVLDQQQ